MLGVVVVELVVRVAGPEAFRYLPQRIGEVSSAEDAAEIGRPLDWRRPRLL
jgi:hypothetical protein